MITKSLQDYLEYICNKISEGKDVKAIDIACDFGISRSSVSEALIKLADKDLIIYEGRKGIQITPFGIQEAKKIIKKHKILFNFFSKILNINEIQANDNACKIEHVINDKVIAQIKIFSDFCIKKGINKQFMESIKNDK